MLVDSGSTYNFIKGSVARRLRLPATTVSSFRVLTGSGTYLACSQQCKQVHLDVQGVKLVLDCFILELSGVDVVLGVQWLAQLGNVVSNYRDMTMSFFYGGKQVLLKGKSALELSQLPSKSFCKLLDSDSSHGLYTLHYIADQEVPQSHQLPSELREVLSNFGEVFAEPSSLPPSRHIDHRIELVPNAQPVNVRPYRYPHFQKEEMERLVAEMLKSRVIQDSHSAFSSPVLLVKKKRWKLALLCRLPGSQFQYHQR